MQISVEPGVRLSDLALQDSYSYELGHIYMGAENERELEARYARCLERLTFQFDE